MENNDETEECFEKFIPTRTNSKLSSDENKENIFDIKESHLL